MSLHLVAALEQMRCKASSTAQPFSNSCVTSCNDVSLPVVNHKWLNRSTWPALSRCNDLAIRRALALFHCVAVRNPELIQRNLLIEIRDHGVLTVHPRELHRG